MSYLKVDKSPLVGVVNGLAWTAVGGDVLKIEVIRLRVRDNKSLLVVWGM